MNETAQKIVATAEQMIREGGYHSFSFRQIADQLGIKSASIHYHFPSKAALGVSVAESYTSDFLNFLGEPSGVGKYIKAFQNSLKTNKRACLCGILAAEAGKLPEPMLEALQGFTQKNLDWLKLAVAAEKPEWSAKKQQETAFIIFSALEGAMTFSAMTKQPSHLKQVGDSLMKMVD